MIIRGLVLSVVTAVVAAVGVAGATPAHAGSGVWVGTQVLSTCGTDTYCGTLRVPLDWQLAGSPDISVCYQWYPATGRGPAAGTVVPVEGGPGYPSIGSVSDDGYAAMYGPVLKHDNMLAIDLRGTGCSTAINCPALQNYTQPSGTLAFAAVVGKCGDSLNTRWRGLDGTYIHASDLFTSAAAAQDVAAVIRALGLSHVDVYGDSYGSWFAQVFAARYPGLVHSLILDSTYQVQGLDAWYRSTIQNMPADFDVACARTPACAAYRGTSWARIEALAKRLDAHPVTGKVPGPGGTRETVTMNTVGLVNLVSDAAEDPAIYAALDAAARALLDGDSVAPLLRLYASRLAVDEAYFGEPVGDYSVGLYMAVSCLDYPQLFPMSAQPAARLTDLHEAEAALPAGTFAPFTTAQWLAMNQNTETFTACLDWPVPTIAQPPVTGSKPFLPSNVPVLILGGELDTWTPPSGVPAVRAQIGGHRQFVEFANETHVVGEGDSYGCASGIIQAFVRDPAAKLDTSCAARVPSIRAVGSFAGSLAAVAPVAGTGSAVRARRLAAAAVDTAGDAVTRWESVGDSPDAGLYGGSFTASASGAVLTLVRDELVPGAAVSGTVRISGTTVRAVLTVPGLAGHIVASWPLYGGSARARVTLPGGGSGTMPAPEGVPY